MTRQHHTFPRHGLLAIALGLLASSISQALTLDDFDTGSATLEVPAMPVPLSGALDQLTTAMVPGGSRNLGLIADPQSQQLAFISVGKGDLQAYTVASQPLSMSFGYGTSLAMDLDLSGLDFLRLDMIWAGAQTPTGYDRNALEMTIYATTSNGIGLNPDGSATHVLLDDIQDLDIPLSSFKVNSATGVGVNWADVDGMLFVVSEVKPAPRSYAGFGIARVEILANAVPEPASWALVAAGLLGLAWHRRPVRR